MVASFDGASGQFTVGERDPAAPGFLRWGRLSYAGRHYLKFQDGPYWLKGGTDEPENLLAYKGFDDTRPSSRLRRARRRLAARRSRLGRRQGQGADRRTQLSRARTT